MVATELNNMGLHYTSLELGEVDLKESLSKNQRTLLKTTLQAYGLELMEDKNSSVAHLSHQFKKVTGLTSTFFKGIKIKKLIEA